MLKIVETYDDGYQDYEVFKCTECGKQQTHLAGADPCCCPDCEVRE